MDAVVRALPKTELHLHVGGNLGGPVFPDMVFPAQMLVDYVRLYRLEPA